MIAITSGCFLCDFHLSTFRHECVRASADLTRVSIFLIPSFEKTACVLIALFIICMKTDIHPARHAHSSTNVEVS